MGKKGNQVEETAQQRELAKYAQDQMVDYKDRWLPVQKNLVKTIQESGERDSGARTRAHGRAASDTAAAFEKAGSVLERTMTQSGGLGSSKAKLAITGQAEDEATSRGLGITMADQQVDDAYTEGLAALAAVGRGERAAVGDSLSRQATSSARQAADDAEASLMNRAENAEMAGQVVGFGLQRGLGSIGKGGVGDTNDFSGVTGDNAVDMWTRLGSGGD